MAQDLDTDLCGSGRAVKGGVLVVIVAYVVSCILFLPYATRPGAHVPAIVAMYSVGIFITELATAALLMAAYESERRPSFIVLGCTYLFSSLMAIAHVLTFNGALLPDRAVLPMAGNGTAWIFVSWVVLFALGCLTAITIELSQARQWRGGQWRAVVVTSVVAVALVVVIVSAAQRYGDTWLPRILTENGRWTSLNAVAIAIAVSFNIVSIIGALSMRTERHEVFLWLALALTAMVCANVISLASGGRFSLGWIVGRMSWLLSASVLFVYFLVQHVSQSRKLRRSNELLADEIEQSTGRLYASEARLAAIVSTTSEAILSKSLDGRITSWNEGAERLLKYTAEEMIGRSVRDVIPENRQGDEDEVLSRIVAGERVNNYETARVAKDGEVVEVSMTVSPLIVRGKLVGASSVMHDISARKARERHTNLLLREINHRSKNLLAVVQAVARQTVVHSPRDFFTSFNERLHALAVSQDLLVKSHWRGVDLADLVRLELSRYRELIGIRVFVVGPSLVVSAAAAQNLGMALHELATNAGKFGPLSGSAGQVEVGWTWDGDSSSGRFTMHWIERGGPRVQRPAKTGFGTTLTTDILRTAFGGAVQLDYHPDGLLWRLDAPLSNIAETPVRA